MYVETLSFVLCLSVTMYQGVLDLERGVCAESWAFLRLDLIGWSYSVSFAPVVYLDFPNSCFLLDCFS